MNPTQQQIFQSDTSILLPLPHPLASLAHEVIVRTDLRFGGHLQLQSGVAHIPLLGFEEQEMLYIHVRYMRFWSVSLSVPCIYEAARDASGAREAPEALGIVQISFC